MNTFHRYLCIPKISLESITLILSNYDGLRKKFLHRCAGELDIWVIKQTSTKAAYYASSAQLVG